MTLSPSISISVLFLTTFSKILHIQRTNDINKQTNETTKNKTQFNNLMLAILFMDIMFRFKS